MGRIPADADLEDSWTRQWRRAVYKQCFEEARRRLDAKTITAFVKYVEQGIAPGTVAQELGMTVNAVYLAKHHVLRMIRQMIPQMEEIF